MMRSCSPGLEALGLALIVAACARGGEDDRGGFARADSAGITIATNEAPAASLASVLTVSADPRLRIGADSGADELLFNQIRGVARLDDGRIAVANGQPPEIRIFDANGRFIARHGRRGQGPGEFQGLTRLLAGRGDTLLAVNMPRFQLQRFTVGGGYVGMTTVNNDSITPLLMGMRPTEGSAEYLRNGAVIVAAEPATDGPTDGSQFPTGELFRRQVTEVWVNPERSRSALLGTFGDIEQMFIDIGGGRRSAEIPPNSRWARHALDARGSRYCVSGNEAPEVRCVDESGRRLIIRWSQDTVPTSNEVIERWRADVRERAARPGSRTSPEIAEKIIAGIIIPPARPPVGTIIVASGGRLLVSGPDLSAPEGRFRYRVFSPEGELLGYADLPPLGFADLGDGYLLGVTRDEDGIESVVEYAVTRRD